MYESNSRPVLTNRTFGDDWNAIYDVHVYLYIYTYIDMTYMDIHYICDVQYDSL